jgi:hypothetical protein
MTPAEIEVKVSIARREMQFWQEVLTRKGCKDCKHWQHPGCGLAEGIHPPPDVVKEGCPEWLWDGVPF